MGLFGSGLAVGHRKRKKSLKFLRFDRSSYSSGHAVNRIQQDLRAAVLYTCCLPVLSEKMQSQKLPKNYILLGVEEGGF